MATKAAIRDETRKRPTTAQSGPARVDEARSDQDVASELTATHRWTSLDVGLFEFGFVLVVIGTFLSARSRDPVFWLLAGPGLTAAVVTMIMFIRQGFGRRGLIRILKRHGSGITPPLPPDKLWRRWNDSGSTELAQVLPDVAFLPQVKRATGPAKSGVQGRFYPA